MSAGAKSREVIAILEKADGGPLTTRDIYLRCDLAETPTQVSALINHLRRYDKVVTEKRDGTNYHRLKHSEPERQCESGAPQSPKPGPGRTAAATAPAADPPAQRVARAGALRFALFSDGALEIHDAAQPVFAFTPQQTHDLVEFLDRVLNTGGTTP